MKECVVVLGMHRSGTSVLTGLISLFGGYVGSDLMPPTKDNPKGYYENNKIYLLNERILEENNASWDDYTFSAESLDSSNFEKYVNAAKNVITDELKYVNNIIIKDPRLCVLFPIWEKALNELNINIKLVFAFRSPLEVSHSLLKRDQIAIEKGLMIWSHYFLQAEFYSRKYSRMIVEYNDDFKDMPKFLDDLATFLGKANNDEILEKAADLYSHKLKHHEVSLDAISDDLPTYLNDLVKLLKNRKFEDLSKLDEIKSEFKNSKLFYLCEVQKLIDANSRLTELNIQLNQGINQLGREKSQLETKVSTNDKKIKLFELETNKIKRINVNINSDLESIKKAAYLKNKRVESLESRLLAGNRIFEEIIGSSRIYKTYKKRAKGSIFEGVKRKVLPFKNKESKNLYRDKLTILKSGLFSHFFYLSRYTDVLESGVDPLDHFCRYGWKEGRNPNIFFDTKDYLEMYPDVYRSNINPFIHYIVYGKNEGRLLPKSSYSIIDPATFHKESKKSKQDKIKNILGRRTQNKKLPTVLLVAHSAGDLLYGGERSFFDMVKAASQCECNVAVVLPRLQQEMIEQLKPFATNILILRYGWWKKDTPIDDDVIKQFICILNDFCISLVHVNTIMLREVLFAAKKVNIPSTIHIRELITGDKALVEIIGEKAQEIVTSVNGSSDFIIANSHETAKAYGNNEKISIIHNTVDTDLFDIENIVDGVLKVGLISSNIDKKGVFEFVEIAEKCLDEKNLQFVLIGPISKEIKIIEEIIAKKSLVNLSIAGYVNTSVEAVAKVNIILNISKFTESFGRTVLEGMAARRPVIAYSWGAIQELIKNNETGYLVPYLDVDKVAEKLKILATDYELVSKMGEAARERAIIKFGFGVYTKKVRNFYKKVLSNPKASDLHDAESKHQKIAYFLWHFPVPSETFVLNELRILVERAYDVIVFCKQSPFPDFTPDFTIQWEKVSSPKELAKKLIKTNRTIVHSHFTYPTVTDMVWPACEIAKINFTFIAHAQDIFKYENIEKNRIGEISQSPFCKNVLVPSRYHREYVIEQGVIPSKIIINPNGIDPNLYAGKRGQNEVRETNLSVCAIHRYTEKKGLENLILSAPLLDNKNVEIHIYGYGELEEEYIDIIKKNSISNVHVHGGVKGRTAMLEIFAKNDAFLCPSVRAESGDMDGIPTVLMEAMAYGILVIGTDISGIPDLISNNITGFIAEASPQGVANTINKFYRATPKQIAAISKAAKDIVYKKYNSIKLVNSLVRTWSSKKSLDIIIVSWNNLIELKEVVRRIQKYTLTNYNLLICDNNSEDDVKQYLEELQLESENVRVFFNPNNSMVGPGSNIAIEMGSSEYVIYVCGKEGFVFDYNWEQNFIGQMDDCPKAGLGGTLCYSPSYLIGKDYAKGVELFDLFRNKKYANENPNRIFRHVQGGFFILRRKMYQQIGGFSQQVNHAYTDVEYSYYAESCGWELTSVEGVLSLYNKSRPTIFSRMDESIIAIHPPTLEQLPLLDKITKRETHFCNICEWNNKNSQKGGGCPQCGSHSDDRTLYRYLAESTLTYRRLPAISLDLPKSLHEFWGKQFQGENLSLTNFNKKIKNGKTKYSNGSMKLFYYNNSTSNVDGAIITEASRVLETHGILLLHQTQDQSPPLPNVIEMLKNHGMEFSEEISYSSSVVQYGVSQLLVFERSNDDY